MSRLGTFVVSIWLGSGTGAMAFVGCIEADNDTAPDHKLSRPRHASIRCPTRSSAQASGVVSELSLQNPAELESYDNRSRFFPDFDPEDDRDCIFGR